MNKPGATIEQRFDPAEKISILQLPEGNLARGVISKMILRGEQVYDPLWRYVRKVNKKLYRGQKSTVRFGEFTLGLRSHNRIPAWIDFKKERLYLGRKLTIPFPSIRGLMVAHGLLPNRKFPVFAVLIKVDGCEQYLPIHTCVVDSTVIDLADFLSVRLHAPFGFASRPLSFFIGPGGRTIIHSSGQTPLYEVSSVLTIRDPSGNTKISLMTGTKRITLVNQADPLGWIESWGIIADDLISIISRRTRPKYGRK